MTQVGGGRCSLCNAEGTNKSTCPLNPNAKNPNFEKHRNNKKSMDDETLNDKYKKEYETALAQLRMQMEQQPDKAEDLLYKHEAKLQYLEMMSTPLGRLIESENIEALIEYKETHLDEIIDLAETNKKNNVLKFIIADNMKSDDPEASHNMLFDHGLRFQQLDATVIKWMFDTYPKFLQYIKTHRTKTWDLLVRLKLYQQ